MSVADLSVGAPAAPDVEGDADEELELGDELDGAAPAPVSEAMVRGALMAIGQTLHQTLGDDDVDDHWRFSEDELAVLVPAVSRIAARRPKLARAIERGDEIFVAVTIAGYAGRNLEDATKARRARAQLQGENPNAAGGGGPMARGGDVGGVGDGRGWRGVPPTAG